MEWEPDLKAVRNFSGQRSEIHYKSRDFGTWVKVDDWELPAEFVVIFWPRKDVDEPLVEMHFAVIDGVPQCRGVVTSAIKGKREVRAADLRAIKVEDVLEDVLAQIAIRLGENGEIISRPFVDESRRDAISAVRGARREGRRKVTEAMLREVTGVYRANPDDPTAAVAQHFDKKPRTARYYIKLARDAGHLDEPEGGDER